MKQAFGTDGRVTLVTGEDGVAHVRLSRPDKLNALDASMFEALVEAGAALSSIPGVRVAVLAGEGRAFCAGLDLASFADPTGLAGRDIVARDHGVANLFQQAALVWRQAPVPVIAAVHGACLGGGLQIASGADIRIAAPDARLSIMELKWGIVPDMAGFALWRGMVRDDVLRELIYTAREFSGDEALQLGLATIVDPDPLARALALAQEIAAKSPDAIRSAKELANLRDHSEADVLLAESRLQQELLFSKNQIEAVRSQIERRAPRFDDP